MIITGCAQRAVVSLGNGKTLSQEERAQMKWKKESTKKLDNLDHKIHKFDSESKRDLQRMGTTPQSL